MPINQVTIPQPETANNAPNNDGTRAAYQTDSTLVPDPGKANGKLGTGSNAIFIPSSTPIPSPNKADDKVGTGSNLKFVPESTPVANPTKADGNDGSWSNVPFANGIPIDGVPIPHPGLADDR